MSNNHPCRRLFRLAFVWFLYLATFPHHSRRCCFSFDFGLSWFFDFWFGVNSFVDSHFVSSNVFWSASMAWPSAFVCLHLKLLGTFCHCIGFERILIENCLPFTNTQHVRHHSEFGSISLAMTDEKRTWNSSTNNQLLFSKAGGIPGIIIRFTITVVQLIHFGNVFSRGHHAGRFAHASE